MAAALERVGALGGEVVHPGERWAICRDSEGTPFGLAGPALNGGVRLRGLYPWPLKPFDTAHPVRGYFNDPRIAGTSRAFHFGIDISAPNGTPVHAVRGGVVHLEGTRSLAVSDGDVDFGYWHVIPAVAHHSGSRRASSSATSRRRGCTSTSPSTAPVSTATRCGPGALTPWTRHDRRRR